MAALGFGARIRQAILDQGSRLGQRYTNVQFGVDVGLTDKGRPYSTQTVSDWIAERSEPSISTFRAMAKVTGKEPAWLMALDMEPADRGVDAVVQNKDGTVTLIQTKASSDPNPRPPASRAATPDPAAATPKLGLGKAEDKPKKNRKRA